MLSLEKQPKDAFLRVVKSLAASIGGSAVNAKWTSYGALEVDVFFNSKSDFELFAVTTQPLARIEFFRDLNEAPRFRPTDEAITEAVEYFNSERFWEAHEEIEAVWRASSGAEKLLLQGLILVCTAYVHHQKAEGGVAFNVLRRARKQLDWKEPAYNGIDLVMVRRKVDEILSSGMFLVFQI